MNLKFRPFALLCALVAAHGIVAGCNSVPPPVEGRGDPYLPPQVSLDSDELRTRTAIQAPAISRDPSNILHVTLPVRNTTNDPMIVEYRLTFLDHGGQVMYQSAWLRKDLTPNVGEEISGNCTMPGADGVRIDLRKADIATF